MGRFSRIQNTTTTTTSNIPQSRTFCAVRARSATYSDLGSSQTSFYIGLKWLTLNTFRYFNFYSVVAQQGCGPPCPRLAMSSGLKERKPYPAENRVLAPAGDFPNRREECTETHFLWEIRQVQLQSAKELGLLTRKYPAKADVYMSYFWLSFLLMRRREGNTAVKDWTVSRYPRSDREL